jgi:hypothetical protein
MDYCWNGPFWSTNHHQGGQRVVFFLSDSVHSYVVAHILDTSSQCVWVITLPKDKIVDPCSISAPNFSQERMVLW